MDFADKRGNRVKEWIASLDRGARVKEWIASLDRGAQVEVKAALNTQLRILAARERLGRPDVGFMRRECKGLLEIVLTVGNVEYRPLAYYGPDTRKRQVTILRGAIEKDGRLQPPTACATALRRIEEIRSGAGKAVPHDYS